MIPLRVLSVVLSAFGAQAPEVVGPVITMEDAVRIAERRAFAVLIQRTRVENARQGVAAARAGLLPRAQGGVTYTRFDQAITAQLDPAAPPVVFQPLAQRTATLGGSLPIDLSGAIRGGIGAARENERAQRWTLAASLNDARFNARNSFLTVLRAQAAVAVQDSAVELARAQLEQGRLQFEQQQIARVDVTRFETLLAQAENERTSARNSLQIAKNALNFLLNRPIETPVEATPVGDLPPLPTGADDIVAVALAARPELRSLEANVRALGQQRRVAEAADDPQLNLAVNYQRNLDAFGFGARVNQTTTTLALTFPFFDAGATRARVRQIRQDEEQARLILEQNKLAVSQEARNALVNLANAQERRTTAERQVALAEEVLRLARVRRDAGEATYVEIVDAQNQLILARNGLVSARYDYLVAFAQLQRAVGGDDLTPRPAAPAGGAKS